MGRSLGVEDERSTDEMPQLYEAALAWEEAYQWPSLQLKGIKGRTFFFLTLLPFYCRSFHGMMRADPAVAGRDDIQLNKRNILTA